MEFVKCVKNQGYESLLDVGRLYERSPNDQEEPLVQIKDKHGSLQILPRMLFAEPSPEDHMQEFNRIVDEIPVEGGD